MLYFIIFVVPYLAFAIFFIKSTWNVSNKIQRMIIVGFFVLLPSWDFVLGSALYCVSWPFFPKQAIYETAEVDGIYYEGAHRKTIVCRESQIGEKLVNSYIISSAVHDFEKGYKYSEALISKSKYCPKRLSIESPQIYRCSVTDDSMAQRLSVESELKVQCGPVENIQSGYEVKLTNIKIGSYEMNSIDIRNRTTGKLMAEYKEIVNWLYLPYFKWLDWAQYSSERQSKPNETRFYDFQYDVLKVKKSQSGA